MRTLLLLVVFSLVTTVSLAGSGAQFKRGDANSDDALNIGDPVTILGFLFPAVPPPAPPTCMDALDANDDGGVDIGDPVFLLVHLFSGGAAPPPPFGICGVDPTPDPLGCVSYPHCGATGVPPIGSPIEFRGVEVVLQAVEPNGFGAGTILHFDTNNDGTFDQQVVTDADNIFTISLDVSQLLPPVVVAPQPLNVFVEDPTMTIQTQIFPLSLISLDPLDLSSNVPVPDPLLPVAPISAEWLPVVAPTGPSLELFTQSLTPQVHGVELASGRVQRSVPLRNFPTRLLGFDFTMHYATGLAYASPFGNGFSHSFGLQIIRDGLLTGRVVTPDMRVYPITSADGLTWQLPVGFRSLLSLDPDLNRWTLTHYSGLELEVYEAAQGHPGKPRALREPNGNRTALTYDNSGFLTQILTDLDQPQLFSYDGNGRLSTYTDHVAQVFEWVYDAQGRVVRIIAPATPHLVAPTFPILIDPSDVVTATRNVTELFYDDVTYPDSITRVHDGRGLEVRAYEYNGTGRCDKVTENGADLLFETPVFTTPTALPVLDAGNVTVRVTDRAGNVTDYEMHGPAGNGTGVAATGLRRTVEWTCTGIGAPAARPGEPNYFDTRWFYDSNDLTATKSASPVGSSDAGVTYGADAMPTNRSVTTFTYNGNRQPTARETTDGTDTIRTEDTYDTFSNFSRHLTHTGPQLFDTYPVYSGLSFVETYTYDSSGNRILRTSPTITLGQPAPQTIIEEWEYNSFGQLTKHIDGNGNQTTYDYYSGASTGGTVNTQGTYGGYTSSITAGATGSTDTATNQSTLFEVNAFGWVTKQTNARGFIYTYEYDAFGNRVLERAPTVTLSNATTQQFETRRAYDQAGHLVLEEYSNVDYDGTVDPLAFTYDMHYYDANSNRTATRESVDSTPANDLVTQFDYDANENLVIVQKPEGNRDFHVYDERDLLLRTFEGIGTGATIDDGYPTSKSATTLSVPFLRTTRNDYDANGNVVTHIDGRGNASTCTYDGFDRLVLRVDQNGNGVSSEYDDASNLIRTTSGVVTAGTISTPLEVRYFRYDEINRRYLTVTDGDPASNEGNLANPTVPGSPTYTTLYDAADRVVERADGNGNLTTFDFDAADRVILITDPLNNEEVLTYDANDNVVQVREREVAAPGVPGVPEEYDTTRLFDELDRMVEEHDLGQVGSSLDCPTTVEYDSRNNVRVQTDEEGRTYERVYDGADRLVEEVRRDGDVATGPIIEDHRFEYDANDNVVEQIIESDPGNPAGDQVTRFDFDDLDRVVRIVAPDSDDPLTGTGLGGDGVFDRTEVEYDANDNVVRVTDPRGTETTHTYDAADRKVSVDVTVPAGVGGVSRREMTYDGLDRMEAVRNDFSETILQFDSISRVVSETSTLNLQGTGFLAGWSEPMEVISGYDDESNRVGRDVVDPTQPQPDLSQDYFHDPLNRLLGSGARFFDDPFNTRPIGDWAYFGPERVVGMQTGNGATLDRAYDPKRRLAVAAWNHPFGGMLAAYEYAHDEVDNPLFERLMHDNGLHDNFRYDGLDRLTGTVYRDPAPADYRTAFPPAQEAATYDANHNRLTGTIGNVFNPLFGVPLLLGYNLADEIVSFNLSGNAHPVSYDAAGHRSQATTLAPGVPGPLDMGVTYDAFGRAIEFVFPGGLRSEAIYDGLNRRLALLRFNGPVFDPLLSTRFICDGMEEVVDRRFAPGSTLAAFNTILYRVRALAGDIAQSCLTVKDVNGDRQLFQNTNQPGPNDAIYFELFDGRGNLAAILDAGNPQRILEYFRYQMMSAPIILPVVDNNADNMEDTPNSLQDNGNFAGNPSQYDIDIFLQGLRYDEFGFYYGDGEYLDPLTNKKLSRTELLIAHMVSAPMILPNPGCCDTGGSVDPLSNPELFKELWDKHNEKKDGSVDPLTHPELFPDVWKKHNATKGGSVDPLSNPDLFPQLWKKYKGGSVDPLSNPELFKKLWDKHNGKNGGSVDPLSNPGAFPQLWKKHKQGRSVDPLNDRHLFKELWDDYMGRKKGSIGPVENPGAFPELWKKHNEKKDNSVDVFTHPKLFKKLWDKHNGKTGGSIGPVENPGAFPELWKKHNEKKDNSVDPLNHKKHFKDLWDKHNGKGGGTTGPIESPGAFPDLWKKFRRPQGSVDPINHPWLFNRHMARPLNKLRTK